MVRVRVRLGYTMAIYLVLQHQVSPYIYIRNQKNQLVSWIASTMWLLSLKVSSCGREAVPRHSKNQTLFLGSCNYYIDTSTYKIAWDCQSINLLNLNVATFPKDVKFCTPTKCFEISTLYTHMHMKEKPHRKKLLNCIHIATIIGNASLVHRCQ